jgi:RNA polymerase-binding transcription factor DksA
MTALSLSPSQTEELRKRLGLARANTAEFVRARIDSTGEPPPVSHLAHRDQPDDDPQAIDIGDRQIALAGHEEALLAEIDQAMARLDEGIANLCTGCGNAIGFERLLAVPTAQTCIACQLRIERRDHVQSGPTL